VTALRDLETAAPGGGLELRVWLRLLTCATLVEGALARRLRERFGATQPRFDLMALLDRARDGLTPTRLAEGMMVSPGNVSGLVERLAAEGLVARRVDPEDRRSATVTLTEAGRAAFAEMAEAHRTWVAELLAGLDGAALGRLYADLGALKASADAAARADDRPR
jgi:DNA-binding MarR family transcriptional regulator